MVQPALGGELVRLANKVDPGDVGTLKTRQIDNNIYAIRVPEDKSDLVRRLCDGFYVGWDRRPKKGVRPAFAARFSAFLLETYGEEAQAAFDVGAARYNPWQPPPPPFHKRAYRKLRRMIG